MQLLTPLLAILLCAGPSESSDPCPPPSILFCGAAGSIFGSCHLLDTGKEKVLLDCGLFQEEDLADLDVDQLNRELLFDPRAIDAVFITHAHADHVGKLPWLVKNGFSGPVYCTPVTAELSELMLELYAWIISQESGLYGAEEVSRALRLISTRPEGSWFATPGGTRARFLETGHILGAAMVELRWELGEEEHSLVYTGDLGNPDSPLLRPGRPLPPVRVLVVESTYGDRLHSDYARDMDLFRNILNDTLSRGGKVLIPSYVLSRSQKVVYHINELVENGLIDVDFPVYVDSVYANKISAVYRRHPELYDAESQAAIREGDRPLSFRGLREYRPNEKIRGPAVIIAPSGATTTGKILDHLARYLADSRSAVIFVGYQPEGGLGRDILQGKGSVLVDGRRVPVRASSHYLGSFSGHPDYSQILDWLRAGARPGRAFVVHGQPSSAENLARLLREELNIPVQVPGYGECFSLDSPLPTVPRDNKSPGLTDPGIAPRGIEPLSPD